MGIADEARAEMIEIQRREGLSNGWRARIADALIAAGYRKPEAAPSDTDREALVALQLTGYGIPDAGDGYPSTVIRSNEEAADLVIAAGFRRSPVQVTEVQNADELRDAIDHVRGGVEFQDAINPEAIEVVIAAALEAAAAVTPTEPEWGVWEDATGIFYHVDPPTEKNARREAVLVGTGFRAVPASPVSEG